MEILLEPTSNKLLVVVSCYLVCLDIRLVSITVAESDPKEDPEEYEDDETEDGSVDYPMDGGDDGDDDDDEEEEEEHLASADSAVVLPTDELSAISLPPEVEVERLLAMPTPSPSPLTSLSPPSAGERLARCTAPAALPSPPLPPPLHMSPPIDRKDDIPETEMSPSKRLCLSTLGSRYKVGESSTARPTGGRGIDYGFVSTLDAEARRRGIGAVGYGIRDTWIDPAETVLEIAPMTVGEVNIRVIELAELHEHDTHDLYALLEDAQDNSPGAGVCIRVSAPDTATAAEYSYSDTAPVAQMAETLRVMGDMRREMGDMQAELLSLRTEGVVGLTQWNEKMESVFQISGCAIENQVKFATCTLLDAALTWWNSKIRSLGPDAYSITWEVKENNVSAYTERFQELTLICTKFVANETENIDKYVRRLPDNIYGSVKDSKPKTLDETIELANDLMDQKLRTYAERQSNNKRRADESFRNHDGHFARDCRSSGNANVVNSQRNNGANPKGNGCFECGATGHFKRDCPKLKNKYGEKGNALGWVYAVGNAENRGNASRDPDSNVVTGMFLLNNRYASILFDTGVDRSFISTVFSSLIDIVPTPLGNSYDVELADGKIVEGYSDEEDPFDAQHILFEMEVCIFGQEEGGVGTVGPSITRPLRVVMALSLPFGLAMVLLGRDPDPEVEAVDVFVSVGKFTFPADFVIVDYESDPRVPLILGRPFLRTTRALIDVHGEEMILRDDDERLTVNMRHDTSSYSNQPQKESINLINVFNNSSEDFLENLFSNQPSGNPTFSSHHELTSSEVNDDIFDSEGGNVLFKKLLDLDSTKDLHPPFHFNPLKNVYDDPFDSKGEKIKESKLLIDEIDIPCDFLLPSEYDSFISQDFSRVDALPSTNNKDKVFNPCILIQEKSFEIITRIVQDKKLATSNSSLVLEDFDPPFYEPFFFKEVPRLKCLIERAVRDSSLSIRIFVREKMSRDVITIGSTMWILLLYRVSLAGNAQNAPPTLKDPKFWTAEEKKTRKIERLARYILIQGLPNDIYSLIVSNETAKDLWDALERQMRGSEYGEQDRKAAILYEYETFKAIEGEQFLETYLRYLQVINDLKKCGYKKDSSKLNYKFLNNLQPEWKQYGTLMRQTKNLMDINIEALYNILKQNQGDVNDALGYKKKAIVVTSDPLALVAEKTKVIKQKERVVVSSDSEGSGADDFSKLEKITALLAKAFNRRKFYSKPTNNNFRTSSTSQSANKKQEFVKSDDKKVEKKADEKKRYE
nr:hypothetical protein [Tanacetum cinerariifolium]